MYSGLMESGTAKHVYILNLDSEQVVMLGSGDEDYARRILATNDEMPDFFKGHVAFSNSLAHEIMAACDILLMPSRFEPCGLNQLYAMRYGTIPVACATGGLNDTIDDVSPFAQDDTATGTGWTFALPTPRALLAAVKSAVQVWLCSTGSDCVASSVLDAGDAPVRPP